MVFLLAQAAALFAAAYFVLKFLLSYYKFHFSPLWKLPGPPKKSWLFGAFLEILQKPFMEPHLRWIQQFDGYNVDMYHYSMFFGGHSVMIMNADIVRQIFMAPNRPQPKFYKKFFGSTGTIGKGLVLLEGEDWHRHRRIIHPSFQVAFLKEKINSCVPAKVKEFIECWKKDTSREILLEQHFSNLTLDVIGDVAFTHNFHGLDSIKEWSESGEDKMPEVTDKLMRSLNEVFKIDPKRIFLNFAGLSKLDFVAKRSEKAMNEAVDQVIGNARRQNEEKSQQAKGTKSSSATNGSKYAPKSVLELLFDAKDTESKTKQKLTDFELREEIKTFLIAGHETTSAWCYWAVFAMTKHPDIQQRVYEDVMKHVANDDSLLDLETVEKMTYLDAFLKECLRFYPPVGMMIRNNTNEEVFNGVTIPADTRLTVPIYLLHRHPKYWSGDPNEFQPERWLQKELPYNHPFAFIPFSAGPRICIGYRFSTMEAKVIMAGLVRAFTFQLAPSVRDAKFELRTRLTIKAKPDLKVCIRPRE